MEEASFNDGAAAQGGGDNPLVYASQPNPGNELGLFATTKILKGTRILSEQPIFKVSYAENNPQILTDHIVKALRDLDEAKRRAFLELKNVYGLHDGPLLGIALSNAKPLSPGALEGGIFLDAARINHSCQPNAHESWNENIRRLTIHPVRDIEQGEEITTSYLIDTMEYDKRQKELREHFKFDCDCSLCSAPLPQRKESDARIQKFRPFENLPIHKWYLDGKPGADYERALFVVRGLLYFYKREGLYDTRISSLYHDAFQCSIKNADEGRARIFAERAYAARVVVEGDDSPEAARLSQFVGQSARHAQVPRGMGDAELEN